MGGRKDFLISEKLSTQWKKINHNSQPAYAKKKKKTDLATEVRKERKEDGKEGKRGGEMDFKVKRKTNWRKQLQR